MAGRLVLVATPIGNLGDLSPRAREALARADWWLVEDTRVSGKLHSLVGSEAPMRVLNDRTPPGKVQAYADQIAEGGTVCLLTDAGSPVVSDPGADLVLSCRERGVEVDALPGPSAVTTALSLSGFFGQRFAFLGYLSRKPGAAKETLSDFEHSALTLVIFESPHRFRKTLDICHQVLGERNYAVCRELTKMHQQVWTSRLPTLPSERDIPAKGEFTIVVEGLRKNPVVPTS